MRVDHVITFGRSVGGLMYLIVSKYRIVSKKT